MKKKQDHSLRLINRNNRKNSGTIFDKNIVKNYFTELINSRSDYDHISEIILKDDMWYSLFYYTENFDNVTKLTERIYILLNNINKKPVCSICLANIVTFKNIKDGYRTLCKKCIGINFRKNAQSSVAVKKRKNTWKNKCKTEIDLMVEKMIRSQMKNKKIFSKAEIMFCEELINKVKLQIDVDACYFGEKQKRIDKYYVDLVYKNKIIEFFGDNVHANPKKYCSGDTREYFDQKLVDLIWEEDNKRIKILKELGYDVKVVWSSDYFKNKDITLQSCEQFLTC